MSRNSHPYSIAGAVILSNSKMFHSAECWVTIWSDILHLLDSTPICGPVTELDDITEFDLWPKYLRGSI